MPDTLQPLQSLAESEFAAREVLKFIIAMGLTWFIATWKKGRESTNRLDAEKIIEPIKVVVQILKVDMDKRFVSLSRENEVRADAVEARVQRIEFLVQGVDGRGGLAFETLDAKRKQAADHDLLVHMTALTRELYRLLTKQEPPPPPSTTRHEEM